MRPSAKQRMLRNTCHYCKCALNDKNRTKDHITPKKHRVKGEAGVTVWACYSCNNRRGDMPYEEFRQRAMKRPLGIRTSDGSFLATKRNALTD